MGEGAKLPKARCHPDRAGVDAAGICGEGHAPYPGRSAGSPEGKRSPRGGVKGRQKSAEAIVVARAPRRRAKHEEPNRREALDERGRRRQAG